MNHPIEALCSGQSLEEIAALLNDNGLSVNNLFQLTDGRWQCNLRAFGDEDEAMRRKTSCYDFAQDDTPRGALIEAAKKAYDKASSRE